MSLDIKQNKPYTYKPIFAYTDEYLRKVNDQYRFLLSGNALRIDIFKVIDNESTVQENSGMIYDEIGKESPIRFMQIKNCVIYNTSTVSIPMEWSSTDGYITKTQIDGVIPTLPFKIGVKDYISFDYSNYKGLFRIENFEESNYEGLEHKKVTLSSTQYLYEDIIQQTRNINIFDYSNFKIIDININNLKSNIGNIVSERYLSFINKNYSKYRGLISNSKIYSYLFKRFLNTNIISININYKETDFELIKKIYYDDTIALKDVNLEVIYNLLKNNQIEDLKNNANINPIFKNLITHISLNKNIESISYYEEIFKYFIYINVDFDKLSILDTILYFFLFKLIDEDQKKFSLEGIEYVEQFD